MKPRAMMIIHNFRPGPTGGAELQAERLARRLVDLGHDMQVLTSLTVPDAPKEEVSGGVRIHRVANRLPYWVTHDNTATFRYLANHRDSFDVLHSHMAYGHSVVAVVAARTFGKKCIIKVACTGEYGDLNTFSAFPGFSAAIVILRQADAVVAISRMVEQELISFGFPADRIVNIPNGVDTDVFRRDAPPSESSKTRFILMGRRHPQKGIDTALRAARRLVDDGMGDKFEIIMYGADYPEHDYRALAKELRVQELVEFRPFEPEVLSAYREAHCLLLPSRGEGMSNALLEAMSMELAVITTHVSGTIDVVDDENDALVVPPDSPDALARRMSDVIHNRELVRDLGLRARAKVMSRFSLTSVSQRYSELYSRVQGVG